ncbi:MAG: hypothetical protein IKD80_05125 [Selenomonadaceae bacterium]|nr:hypothetical protein [Selenomonadaceae bacterium]
MFSALNIWNSREKFWRTYLPRIGNTWVVLGSEARKIAHRLEDKRTHGACKIISGAIFTSRR